MYRYFRPNGFSTCAFSFPTTGQVLKFHMKAKTRVTPLYTGYRMVGK
jgi:hypothetical protein